jgi:hypothetical protein
MAVRHEDLTPEEAARQAGYNASHASAQRRLKDRKFMAQLRQRLARLDSRANRSTK